jgi:lysophospholipid hydrolase
MMLLFAYVKGKAANIYLFQIDCGLVYVVSGMLTLTQRENDREVVMFNAHAGEFIGALAVLTGEPSIFTVRAKHHTKVAVMSSSSFYT